MVQFPFGEHHITGRRDYRLDNGVEDLIEIIREGWEENIFWISRKKHLSLQQIKQLNLKKKEMAKGKNKIIKRLVAEYNSLQAELEDMEARAPYKGWRDRDGYMDYLEGEMAGINEEIERLRATA